MKKSLLFSLFAAASLAGTSQIVVNNTQTTQVLVEDVFLANGIFISNVTFNGANADVISDQIAGFTDATSQSGVSSGLVLSTGHVMDTEPMGFNMYPSNPYIVQDPDILAMIEPGMMLGDNAVLEFDFIATGDSLDFVYVFASDEYPEYVESSFNDHFGFLMSGPGISGTYTNNAVNIALIPGTIETVGINTLNANEHSEFYIDNTNYLYQVGLDAFTVPLHASIGGLQVGEVYHVKIIIADVSDSALDSAVFLQGDSFVQICSDPGDNFMPGQCLLSSPHADVEYTENCGTVELINSSEMGIETTACFYDMGDGNTIPACDAISNYTYAASGTYTVKLTYFVDNFITKYTVGDILVSTVAPTTPVIALNNSMLEITNWDGTSTIQWYVNGAEIEGAVTPSIEVLEDGNYTVVVNNGCPKESAAFFADNIMSVSKGGARLYPNPSGQIAQLDLPQGASFVQVFNALGQVITTSQVTGQNRTTMEAQTGVYAVRISDDQGRELSTLTWVVR